VEKEKKEKNSTGAVTLMENNSSGLRTLTKNNPNVGLS
jgi:hypothetical protein